MLEFKCYQWSYFYSHAPRQLLYFLGFLTFFFFKDCYHEMNPQPQGCKSEYLLHYHGLLSNFAFYKKNASNFPHLRNHICISCSVAKDYWKKKKKRYSLAKISNHHKITREMIPFCCQYGAESNYRPDISYMEPKFLFQTCPILRGPLYIGTGSNFFPKECHMPLDWLCLENIIISISHMINPMMHISTIGEIWASATHEEIWYAWVGSNKDGPHTC